MKKVIFLTNIIFLTIVTIAQQKYAVLITGDYTTAGIPITEQWNNGQDKGTNGFDEFWNDTYLMWEMLVFEKGYEDENVYVLFADGDDYTFPQIDYRYTAEQYGLDHITDMAATVVNVEDVFNGFATGTGGYPKITQDDFLFVWIFDHGGFEIIGVSYFNLIDGQMYDNAFAALVNPIAAHKKVYWMQQCFGGGFHDNLEDYNVFFHSATQPYQIAERANNTPDLENEIIAGITYNHGEFDFHIYSPTSGKSPTGNIYYNGEPYSAADLNEDSYISMYESWYWESTHENNPETPLISDLGNIGSYTSLMYPTLLHTDIASNQTHRGLIGVSKEIHITTGNTLTLHENAVVDILNESKIVVDAGASLVIQDNVTINGGDSNEIIVNGIIQIGENITFNRLGTSGYFSGLMLYNDDLQLNINNASFYYTYLHNYGKELNINNTLFDHCETLHSYNGDITVTNSTFNETSLYIEDLVVNSIFSPPAAKVNSCVFNGNGHTQSAVSITDYLNFFIEENTINGYARGIHLAHSGEGISGNQLIKNNDISGCEY